MHKQYIVSITILMLLTFQAQATLFDRITMIMQVLPIADKLSQQYHISEQQKQDMRTIITHEAPRGLQLIQQLMHNRSQLLSINSEPYQYDDFMVTELAIAQGKLVSELIIWKEHLKYELHQCLDSDQYLFLDELIEQIIARHVTLFFSQQMLSDNTTQ